MHELLAIVHARDEDGKRTHELNGQPVGDAAGLRDALASLSRAAATHALPAVVVDPEILKNLDMARIVKVMSEHSMIFARAGMGGMTISPETDVPCPPYEAGFPVPG